MGTAPSRRIVRQVIDQALHTEADLRAFCIDFFPQVLQQFTQEMDRPAMVKLLLLVANPAALWPALAAAYPIEAGYALASGESVRSPGAEPSKSAPATPLQSPRTDDRNDLYDALLRLTATAFNQVVFYLELRTALLPPESVPQSERAIAVITALEKQEPPGLPRLTQALMRVLPPALR